MNRQIAAVVLACWLLMIEAAYMLNISGFEFNNVVVHMLAITGLAICGLLFRRRNPS